MLWYVNTALLCGGILLVQGVTVTLAGYAFARLRFRGSGVAFTLFLLQLLLVPALLIVPNLQVLVALGLYDTLPGVAAPYLASAFGVFLMRQTFRQLPLDYEEAAALDGATTLQVIRLVLLPMARPGLAAFAVVSLTAHWNEYVWPLMATSSPRAQVLTVGLASFAGASESGGQWGVVAAGTALVAGPLLAAVPRLPAPDRRQLRVLGTEIGTAMRSHPRATATPGRARVRGRRDAGGRPSAQAATELDFFFPVPVQGQLAGEMQRVVEQFNAPIPTSTSPPATPAPTTTPRSRRARRWPAGARRRRC